MTEFLQLVVSALGFGGIYALAALGLNIIFKTSNVVNFAFGAMATVVALLVWTAHTSFGVPTVAAWVLADDVGDGVRVHDPLLSRSPNGRFFEGMTWPNDSAIPSMAGGRCAGRCERMRGDGSTATT